MTWFRSLEDAMDATRTDIKVVCSSSNEGGNEMVNFDEYEDVKPGEKEDTTVTEIKEGTQEEFRSENYWTKVEEKEEVITKMKATPAIEVKTANGATMVINLPANNKVSPKSNLGCWKSTYGDYPKKDQKVTTKIDDNGFNKIVLEK